MKKSYSEKKSLFFFSTVVGLIVFFLSKDFGMFWDNVLFASKMGNHLYYNTIFDWTIPNSFDPGHPPFLGFLLAIAWKIAGQSLWVSHLVMLPFVIGTIYQLHRFIHFYVKNNTYTYVALLLVLADPTLSASFVLINPENIILFFFFLSLNGILYKNTKLKFLGLFFLSIVTFRSMMLFAGFVLFDVINSLYFQGKKFKQIINFRCIIFYFLASLPGTVFVIWRLATKGWLQTHPDSPWESLWHLASFEVFIKNVFILAHRYLDFGRIFIFMFLILCFWFLRKKTFDRKPIQQLFLLATSSVFFVVVVVLLSTNAFGHRYFIVSYIFFTLMAFLFILQLEKNKKLFFCLLLSGLITGNLWIYPEKISQGWDASLAHIPYYELRKEALTFLNNEKISLEKVGTFFPNRSSVDEIDLNGNLDRFASFNEENDYVFYSNVYNLTDENYISLEKDYTEIARFERFYIYVSILKKK